MASIETIKTDLQKEIDGVWVPFAEGIELKIARERNSKYQEELRKLVDPVRKDIRDDTIDIEELNKILLKVRAKTILVDWKNIESKDGETIPYSPEKAEEFFNDPELRDFYIFVVTIASDADSYKKELVKEAEKN